MADCLNTYRYLRKVQSSCVRSWSVVRVQLQPRCRDLSLHSTAQGHEVCLEDPFGFVLRKDALELPAAVDAIERRDPQLRHVRAVNASAADVLGGLNEGGHGTD